MNRDKDFDGLSTRTKNCLINSGYKTKIEIVSAIEKGELQKKDIPNLGKKGLEELMEWYEDEINNIGKDQIIEAKSIELRIRGREHIEFVIFDDYEFSIIYHGDKYDKDSTLAIESMDMEVAKRLRDFLNYAIPLNN